MFLAKPMGILPPYMDTGKMLTIYNNRVAKSQFGSLLQAIARLDSRPRKGLFDLCQDFGHGSSRIYAATGSSSAAGFVRSKKASMAFAGIW